MSDEHQPMNHTEGNGASWRLTTVPSGATVQDAIKSLNSSGLQIALVLSADDHLVGTVTDGDIRRGLLRGLSLTSPIDGVLNKTPFVVPPQYSQEMVLGLMQANKLRHLPVVDEKGRVIGLHLWEKLLTPAARPNKMIVMAGGMGTRLRPRTEKCPKPLLPVAGKPMLEHIIERAKAHGFREFVLAVHHLGHMIEDYFGDGAKWGVNIHYLREETPLGTGGALALLDPRPAGTMIVTNGDVLSDINYGELLEFHNRHDAAATMAVRSHEWQHPFGVVKTDGIDLVGFEEKPVSRTHINAGVYALAPYALDHLIAGEVCDMPSLFMRLQEKKLRTIVYPMHEPWLDVADAGDLERANSLPPREG